MATVETRHDSNLAHLLRRAVGIENVRIWAIL